MEGFFEKAADLNMIKMVPSKYRSSLKKKLKSELEVVVSSLSQENDYLKKTLAESRHHYSALNKLLEALEKNKQWLEYDQQREAYVRAVLARMLWLEKQLNEANKARSQHNEDYSNVNMRMSQMQEHYERLLQKAKDELEVLRDRVDETCQNLIMTQNMCKNKEEEVEELKQQLQSEKRSRRESAEYHSWSENEEEHLTDETRDLRHRLNEEKRKSANLELQTSIREKFFKNLHHVDQRKIAELQRQIEISSQDLEDERQDCSYLKEQMVSVLKMLQNTRGHLVKLSKKEQRDCSPCKATPPPSPPTRESRQSSPHSSLQDGSCLECPICQAQYPVSHYRELTYHLEVCQD
ncbi:centrosomal protein of 55 kDa-like [Tautogolabrus adspersus]